MKLFLSMLLISILVISGCTEKTKSSISVSQIKSANIEVMSQNLAYPAYLAEPSEAGKKSAIVLIHSFNGLEAKDAYREMVDFFDRTLHN